ncbi:tRNA (adenosine(37)-N6)-threonylcarbamoyltransferase complex ATPase subunit type 1 TsaE [Thermopirellula anaerolimosa]
MAKVAEDSRERSVAAEAVIASHSEDDTRRLGRELARLLPDPALVGLVGTLGSGKTRLVQGLAEGCGYDPRAVTSPTFVLIQEYPGRRRLYHFDTYRLKDVTEFVDLGPEEYFARSGICAIEWADRVLDFLPAERLDVFLEIAAETSRNIRLVARHPQYAVCVEALRQLYG